MSDTDDPTQRLAERLRAERPALSELELDDLKRRVLARGHAPSRRTTFLRSRLAIVAALVIGLVMTTGGTGLAISGFSDQSPAQNQYGAPTPVNQVLGEEQSGENPGAGEDPGAGEQPDGDLQPARQVEVSASDELPFTGFAALPILVGGVALLSAGLVMRRRTGSQH